MAKSEDGPQLRSMRGRIAAFESWARTEDRSTRTWPGRRAMLDRFEKEVDPQGKLTSQERAKRAEWARMQRMAMKSATARQRRKLNCQECGAAKEREAPMRSECLRKLCEP